MLILSHVSSEVKHHGSKSWFECRQCTMGQAMEIGSSKIFRSKGLVFAQFWSKSEYFQFWLVKDCSNFEAKIFPSHICQKWGTYWQKTWTGCQNTLKFGMQKDFVVLWKKPENNVLVPGPLHCENWRLKSENICILFSPLQIFEALF